MSEESGFIPLTSEPPLLGRYRLVRLLGEGGSGCVYLAQDLLLGERPVAIKMLRAADSAQALERLKEEAALTQTLNHPHIVQLYSFDRTPFGEDGRSNAFIAMEFVEGSTLRELIAQGPLPVDEALRIFRQLTDGLACAHEAGIVHRDLKPDNILLTSDGVVKLTDFGVAKSLSTEAALTQTGQVMGTPGYMAPELYLGAEATPASDVYSLGLLLYELITGEPLQRSAHAIRDAAREAVHVVKRAASLETESPLVELILSLCCAVEVAARPTSAAALKQLLDGDMVAHPHSLRSVAWRRVKRRLRSAARVLITVLTIAILALMYLGRVTSPYSLAHLYGANIIYKFTKKTNPGLLGVAPLSGMNYMRQRYAYGIGVAAEAVTLSEEARRTIFICGLQHRLRDFRDTIPQSMIEVAGSVGRDCASYPITQEIAEERLLPIAPLTLAAYYGEEQLVRSILKQTHGGRVTQRVIDQTYLQAVRMNRPRIVDALRESNLVPSKVGDELLVEALMSPTNECLERLLATGAPIGFSADFLRSRVERVGGMTRHRWKKTLAKRATQAGERVRRLQQQGIRLESLRDQLTSELLETVVLNHPDIVIVLSALAFDWRLKDARGNSAIHIAARLRKHPLLPVVAAQPSAELDVPDSEGIIPLIRVIGNWDPDGVRVLLSAGSDPNRVSYRHDNPAGNALRFSVPGNYAGMAALVIDDPRTDPNIKSPDGVPPLVLSATNPSSVILKLLLKRGADPFAVTREGDTALHFAAKQGNAEHMRVLLAAGLPADIRNRHGVTPLMMLLARGNDPAVQDAARVLIAAGADPFLKVNDSQNAFDFALRAPMNRQVALLLDLTHFDPSALMPDGRVLLNMIVEAGRESPAFDELLKRGVKLRTRDRSRRNAFQVAIDHRNARLVDRLLQYDPSILNELEGGGTYLNYAAERPSRELLGVLLARGAKLDVELPAHDTVLTRLVTRARPEVIRQVIEQLRPDLNRADGNRMTPLRIAVGRRDAETAKILLEQGADPAQMIDGISPYSLALSLHDPDILNALLADPRVDPNSHHEYQGTSLGIAAKEGDLEAVELLLAHGADPRALDLYGRPALFYAVRSGRHDVIEKLRKAAPEMAHARDRAGMDLKEFKKIFEAPE